MAIAIAKPRLLLVEGIDDKRFIAALMAALVIDAQVEPVAGKTNTALNLRALVKTPGFTGVHTLAIVRDADDDANAAFQSVSGALDAAGLPRPDAPAVFVNGPPRIGIFVLPGNGDPGALETLCLTSVRDDTRLRCVHQFLECLREIAIIHSSETVKAKAMVQAFLGAQSDPGKRLGESAEAGYWPLDSPAFEALSTFLREMAK